LSRGTGRGRVRRRRIAYQTMRDSDAVSITAWCGFSLVAE
jgi:hypothetical protein